MFDYYLPLYLIKNILILKSSQGRLCLLFIYLDLVYLTHKIIWFILTITTGLMFNY